MRFMVLHTLEPGVGYDDCEQYQQLTQSDAQVKGVRSFINMTEGKAVCIYDAPDEEALAKWLLSVGLAFDVILQVEAEGDRQELRDMTVSHARS